MKFPHRPDYCLPPGEHLAECLEALNLTPAEMARLGGIEARAVNGVIKGTLPISPEIAAGLERGARIPARFWLRCEQSYRGFQASPQKRN